MHDFALPADCSRGRLKSVRPSKRDGQLVAATARPAPLRNQFRRCGSKLDDCSKAENMTRTLKIIVATRGSSDLSVPIQQTPAIDGRLNVNAFLESCLGTVKTELELVEYANSSEAVRELSNTSVNTTDQTVIRRWDTSPQLPSRVSEPSQIKVMRCPAQTKAAHAISVDVRVNGCLTTGPFSTRLKQAIPLKGGSCATVHSVNPWVFEWSLNASLVRLVTPSATELEDSFGFDGKHAEPDEACWLAESRWSERDSKFLRPDPPCTLFGQESVSNRWKVRSSDSLAVAIRDKLV